ncbi:polyribonucleotide nucleotidyltransferase [bacterium]|nr:polyribonucleotide nucleotidyltransferase [bacterium]
MLHTTQAEIGGKPLILETGKYARQADGSILATFGETVVLATAVSQRKPREGADFLPLTVDYVEKTYAAGKIPGGFIKREGRPREKETLTSRLLDRPLRPLFPDNYYFETQVIALVLSADVENNPDVIALNAASAALTISDIPFGGPIGAVRVGRVEGEFIANPTLTQLAESDLNLICAGREDAIVMVEAAALMVDEAVLVDALDFAKGPIGASIEAQRELRNLAGKPKREFDNSAYIVPDELLASVEDAVGVQLNERIRIAEKLEREKSLKELRDELLVKYEEEEDSVKSFVRTAFKDLEKRYVRAMILNEGIRADGRRTDEVRPITCDVGLLPRTHGSAVFTRGETQVLAALTLGTSVDEQKIDGLEGESFKRFMLHYNFPPFSVGEASFLRGPGRREIGHGALAEKALLPLMPADTDFPYTIRIVSEVLESNGSSSMATVCSSTLALMDAGVPIAAPVSGIAMGLITEGDRVCVLSDILGLEDHLGEMDFKVTGTKEGVTALQLDVKCGSVSTEILKGALEQAKNGRLHILDIMVEAISAPRESLSPHAPRIITIMISKDKIRDVIGPGGKMIRSIVEQTGVKIDVDDSGEVKIASSDEEASQAAVKMVKDLTAEPEEGKVYVGTVKRVENYGAFVEILPGKEGLLHVSQISEERTREVSDVLKEGDEISVMVLPSDEKGRLRLSRKAAIRHEAGEVVDLEAERPRPENRRPRGGRDDRGGQRRFDRPRGRGRD